MSDDVFSKGHRHAVRTALDAALSGDVVRCRKILKFARTMGSADSMRAYCRQWFKEHAGNDKAAMMAQAFAATEAKRLAGPPTRTMIERPFPWADLDREIRFRGIKA